MIYSLVFVLAFLGSALFKMTYQPSWSKQYQVDWNDSVGRTITDLSYGQGQANKFDLYLPADKSKPSYGLVVYLHAGGFRTGDKSDDKAMLQWLASKGYVAAGINYTLADDKNGANIYSQSQEIKQSIPEVIAQAKKEGYQIDQMAMAGGSAGGTLALLYAYRDAQSSPVPVKMVFEAVGPSSFYPEDWKTYGFDQNKEAAAALFSVMSGQTIKADMFGTAEYDQLVKDISALAWVTPETVPTLLAYGKYDKVQPYEGAERLAKALAANGVPHDLITFENSGHGLQNDSAQMKVYYQKIEEYLNKYLPTK